MRRVAQFIVYLSFFVLAFLPLKNIFAQTFPVQDQLTFQAVNRNMWGPGSAFSLNFRQTLFNVGFPYSATTLGGIGNIAGFQVGAQINIGAGFGIAAFFEIAGFSGGRIDVLYPIDITLDVPSPNTFEKGETITIGSDYAVQEPPAILETEFPRGGNIGLYVEINVRFSLGGRLCLGGCINLPNINVNANPRITIFEITPTSVTYPCVLVTPCGGTGRPPCIPSICTTTFLPANISQPALGVDLFLDIPNVQTTSSVAANKCLVATGEYTYAILTLDIIRYLEIFAGFIPPPAGPIIQNIIGNLSNTISLPFGATIDYTIFSAEIEISVTNRQRFTYCPDIIGNLEFPTPVQFFETDANTGNIVRSGIAKNVPFIVENDINIVYPCNFDWMDVEASYMEENEFSNRTYDSLSVNLVYKVLEFNFNVPSFTLIPRICFPRICVPYPSFCGWSPCIKYACTPAFCTPSLVTPPINLQLGPLFSGRPQLAAIKWDYFNDSWEIVGTETSTTSQFTLEPRDYFAQMTGVDILCFGDTTGEATVTITNGEPPFTYDWSNGQVITSNSNTNTMTGLPAGTHYVIVTNDFGCVAFEEINIDQPSAPLNLLDVDVQNALCKNTATGSIDITVQGGTPPYSYNWNPAPGNTRNINNLAAETYAMTVTDDNGCSLVDSFTITEPDSLLLTFTQTDVSCNGGSDGSITTSLTGGTPPYQYAWSNGASTSNLNNISAGNYTITASDTNNCQFIQNIVISEPVQPIAITFTTTDVLCYGASTGSINLNISGGTAPYDVFWANSNGVQYSTNGATLNNIPADTYNVRVTDTLGCILDTQIAVDQPANPLSTSLNITDVLCNGNNSGSIDLEVSGGTAPYSYSWSNGSNSQDLNAIGSGTYVVEVTDANNCTIIDSGTINQPAAALAGQLSTKNVSCNGGSDGQITSSVSGGTAPYTYDWSNGDSTTISTDLSAGTYDVTVTDDNGCTLVLNATITEPSILQLSSNSSDVSCFGGNDGSLSIQISGGTAPYSIQWRNSSQKILTATTAALSNLNADTYTATVTDSQNCTAQISIPVSQPLAPISTSFSVSAVNCFGGNDGAITTAVSGGTTPYTYAWSNGASTQNLNNLSSGTYILTITDANNCEWIDTAFVPQPQDSLSLTFNTQNVSCFGENDGNITISINGGTAPYFYNWTWAGGNASTQNLNNIASGTYTILVTDDNGCQISEVIAITEPSAPLSIAVAKTDVSCYDGEDGEIALTVSGGTPPYEYYWYNSASIVLSATGPNLEDLSADTYFVIVTDSLGCVDSTQIDILQPQAPISANATITDAICNGGNQGSIALNASGGTAPYSYNWSNGGSTNQIDSLISGNYSVTITDDQGCSWSDTYSIDEPTLLKAETEIVPVACQGDSTGELKVTVEGGTTPYAYNWSNGATTRSIFDLATGSYTLTITDNNGCEVITGGFVEEPLTKLTLTVSKRDVRCFGDTDGQISSKVFGGTPPYDYYWGDTLRLSSNQSETFDSVGAGQYLFRVVDANGCEVNKVTTIEEPNPLELSLSATDVTCADGNDGTAIATASGGVNPYTFIWSTNDTADQITNLTEGEYSVTVIDSFLCKTNESIRVFAPEQLNVVAEAVNNLSCFNRNDGSATVRVENAFGEVTYQWSNGATTPTISNLAPGSYSVTAYDQNNCSDTISVEISATEVECIRIPNSFTPNGDGKNDTWVIGNIDLFPDVTVKIFNKWGNLLYESNGYANPWDGTVNGNPLPSDTYYYVIDLNNGKEPLNGPLTIVR